MLLTAEESHEASDMCCFFARLPPLVGAIYVHSGQQVTKNVPSPLQAEAAARRPGPPDEVRNDVSCGIRISSLNH